MSDEKKPKTWQTPTCRTCVYYLPTGAVDTTAEIGLCRRYPRHLDTNHGNGCGEHPMWLESFKRWLANRISKLSATPPSEIIPTGTKNKKHKSSK